MFSLRTCAIGLLACLLAACGGSSGVKLWPFGDNVRERSRAQVNGVEYQCAGNKRFHVRLLDGGAAAWVILADREFRLERQGDTRYGTGATVLDLGAEGSLKDGAAVAYGGCKPAAAPAAG